MDTPPNPKPPAPLSPEPEPLHLTGKAAQASCWVFIALQAILTIPLFSMPIGCNLLFAIPFSLLCFGVLPALLLLFLPKDGGKREGRLRGLATAALFGIFVPFQFLCADWARSDAQGAIAIIFTSPLAHLIWLLLASPYLISRAGKR